MPCPGRDNPGPLPITKRQVSFVRITPFHQGYGYESVQGAGLFLGVTGAALQSLSAPQPKLPTSLLCGSFVHSRCLGIRAHFSWYSGRDIAPLMILKAVVSS